MKTSGTCKLNKHPCNNLPSSVSYRLLPEVRFNNTKMAFENIQFSKEELARYNRHIIIPEFGEESQQKLKAAKVLIIGSGGLGSPALLYLTAAGVGTIGIVDF